MTVPKDIYLRISDTDVAEVVRIVSGEPMVQLLLTEHDVANPTKPILGQAEFVLSVSTAEELVSKLQTAIRNASVRI